MAFTFQKHKIPESDRLWIAESEKLQNYDARVVKVRLLGKIASDFPHWRIDRRVWSNGELTLVGVYHLHPKDELLTDIDLVIKACRKLILEKPGVDVIKYQDVAAETKLDEARIRYCFYRIVQLGGIASEGGRMNGELKSFESLLVSGSEGYNGLLNYESLDGALEDFYTREDQEKARRASFSQPDMTAFYGQELPLPEAAVRPTQPDTAFVIMAFQDDPMLGDVYEAIKETCKRFKVVARRADEIQHQETITEVVLREIETCEILIADLTFERPNVYYEIGYAHALRKRPIMMRRVGTKLHFDLAVHNVPEWKNSTEVRKLMTDILTAKLGRKPAR